MHPYMELLHSQPQKCVVQICARKKTFVAYASALLHHSGLLTNHATKKPSVFQHNRRLIYRYRTCSSTIWGLKKSER